MFQFISIPELTKTLIASFVGVLTLIGIMTRPFRWNEAMIAMGGASLLLLLGLISPVDAFFTLCRDWNTFLFFLGMMSLSALAEAAAGVGAINWLPDHDQVVRRIPIILALGNTIVPSLTAETLRVAQNASTIIVRSSNAGDPKWVGAHAGAGVRRVDHLAGPHDDPDVLDRARPEPEEHEVPGL